MMLYLAGGKLDRIRAAVLEAVVSNQVVRRSRLVGVTAVNCNRPSPATYAVEVVISDGYAPP